MDTKQLIKLGHKVTFYCPSKDEHGQSIPNGEDILEETLGYLSEKYGGATVTDAQGAWVGSSGTVVREAVKIVYAFCDAVGDLGDIVNHALWIKEEGRQESVGIEIDGEFYLV